MKKLFVSFLLISVFVLLSGCGLNAKQTHPEMTAAFTKAETTAALQSPTITYVSYANDRFGYSIDYPDSFIKKTTSDNGDGIILTSEDGNAELTVLGYNNALGDTAAAFLKNVTEAHSDNLIKTTQDNWAVISWTDGDNVIYLRGVIGTGSINIFLLKYPKTQEDIYTPIITYLETSFKTPATEERH